MKEPHIRDYVMEFGERLIATDSQGQETSGRYGAFVDSLLVELSDDLKYLQKKHDAKLPEEQ